MVTRGYFNIINHFLCTMIPNNTTFLRPLDSTVAGVELGIVTDGSGFSDGDLDLVGVGDLGCSPELNLALFSLVGDLD